MALNEPKSTNDILDELYGNIPSGQVPTPDTGVIKGRTTASPWTGLPSTDKPVSPPPVPATSTGDILEELYGKPKGDIVPTRKEPIGPWGMSVDTEVVPVTTPFPSRTTTPLMRTGGVTSEPRGLLEEIPSAIAGGVKDVAEMGLRAARAVTGRENETLTGGIEALRKVEETIPFLKPSTSPSPIIQSIYGGVRSLIPSLAAGIPSAAIGIVAGGPIGAIVGFALGAGGMFGAAEYDRFREEGIKQGISPEKVYPYALASGLVEGGVEAVADIIGGKILGLGKMAKAQLTLPLRQMIKRAMIPSAGQFAKNFIKQAPVEVGTEMIQEATETWLRNQAGIPTDVTPGEAAREVIGPTIVMTALFGIGARVYNASQAKSLYKAINGIPGKEGTVTIPEEKREVAARFVFDSLIEQAKDYQQSDPATFKQMVELAKTWNQYSMEAIRAGQPINIDESVVASADKYTLPRGGTAEEVPTGFRTDLPRVRDIIKKKDMPTTPVEDILAAEFGYRPGETRPTGIDWDRVKYDSKYADEFLESYFGPGHPAQKFPEDAYRQDVIRKRLQNMAQQYLPGMEPIGRVSPTVEPTKPGRKIPIIEQDPLQRTFDMLLSPEPLPTKRITTIPVSTELGTAATTVPISLTGRRIDILKRDVAPKTTGAPTRDLQIYPQWKSDITMPAKGRVPIETELGTEPTKIPVGKSAGGGALKISGPASMAERMAPSGRTYAELAAHIQNLARNAPDDIAIIATTYEAGKPYYEELPVDIQNKLVDSHVKAVYDRNNGRVIVLTDRAKSINELEESLWHELVGHYGLEKYLGGKFDQFLWLVRDKYGKDGLAGIAKTYKLNLSSYTDMRTAAMEKLAELAETRKDPDLLRRIYAGIRKTLREMGWTTLKLSDAEIDTAIFMSRKLVVDGMASPLVEQSEISDSMATPPFKLGMFEEATWTNAKTGYKYPAIITDKITKMGIPGYNIQVYSEDLKAWRDQGWVKAEEMQLTHPTPGASFKIDTLPSDESELSNMGRFARYFASHSNRNNEFYTLMAGNEVMPETLAKPFTVFEENLGLPVWNALSHKNAMPIMDIEFNRLGKRNEDYLRLTSDPTTSSGINPFFRKGVQDNPTLWKLMIWSDRNQVDLSGGDLLQQKATELGYGKLSDDLVAGYHGWKQGMDRIIDYQISELRNRALDIYTKAPWGQQLADIMAGKLDPASVTFDDTENGKLEFGRFQDALSRTQQRFDDIAQREAQLRSLNFYVPRTRGRGDYVVRVIATEIDPEGNQKRYQVWRINAKSKRESESERIKLANTPEFKGMEIVKSYEPGASEFLYESFSAAKMKGFIDVALARAQHREGLSPEEAGQMLDATLSAMQDEVMVRGFQKTHIHRMGGANPERVVGGYRETDLAKVFDDYASGVAGSMSKFKAYGGFMEALRGIDASKEPDNFNYWSRYVRDMLRNPDSVDRNLNRLKTIPYAWYLVSNLRMAAAQFIQNYMTAAPILSRHVKQWNVSGPGGAARISRAMNDVARGNLTEEQRKMLYEAYIQGEDAAQLVNQMKGRIDGNWAANGIQRIIDIASFPFSGMEKLNRKTALLAMFRTARESGMSYEDAFYQAKWFVRQAHYAYGRSNLPQLLREGTTFSKVGATAYVFRSFTHNYLLSMKYFMRTPEGKIAFDVIGRSLAFIMLAGGVSALPFLDDLLELIEQKTGVAYRSRMRHALKGVGGEMVARFGMQGAPALLGVDLSGSLKVGIPLVGETGNTVYGVWGGLRDKGLKAMQEVLNGEGWRALEAIAPTGIESPLKAARQSREGLTTVGGKQILDESGRPIIPTLSESIAQAMSFRPARVAEISRERRVQSNVESYFREQRNEIYTQARRAKTTGDWNNISKLVEQFNIGIMKYRGAIAPISARSLRSAMKPESDYLRWSGRQGEGGME